MASSRAELIQTVEKQQEQIAKYEKKLREIIRAYKGVLAEKEALAESLQALGHTSPGEVTSDESLKGSASCCSLEGAENAQGSASGISTPKSETGGESDVVSDRELLLQKIATLQKSLSTLTLEKTRTEAALTADKKQLMADKKNLLESIENLEKESRKAKQSLEQQVNEVRANVRQLQCERECEQADHAKAIKDLQQKLQQERINMDHTQKQLSVQQKELTDSRSASEGLERRIAEQQSEMGKLRMQLAEADLRLKSSAVAQDLQHEISRLKVSSKEMVELERKRLCEAEKLSTQLVDQAESRISQLEAHVTDLSQTICAYDQQKLQMSTQIDQLKAKVHQLDAENTELAKDCRTIDTNTIAADLDFNSLPVETLKSFAAKAIASLSTRLPLVALQEAINLHASGCDLHEKCRHDFEQLKDEFERYKLKAQAALKNRSSTADNDYFRDVNDLKATVAGLQLLLDESKAEKLRTSDFQHKTVEELRAAVAEARERSRRQMDELENARKHQISELELEMSKQRDRTLSLLAEKDSEINCLKIWLSKQNFGGATRLAYDASKPSASMDEGPGRVSALGRLDSNISEHSIDVANHHCSATMPDNFSDQGSAVGELQAGTATAATPGNLWFPPDPSNAPSLFYSQELAKKDRELSSLHRAKRELETGMRDIQHSAVTKELQLYNTVENLKEQIQRLEAQIARQEFGSSSADKSQVEYLKNVLVQYMLCDSAAGKQHMLKAIGAALRLNQKEIEQILKHNATWYSWLKSGTK